MLIDNIDVYKDIMLYECSNFKEYLYLLRNGLTPVYIHKGNYYFLQDDKLASLLDSKEKGVSVWKS